MRKLSTLLVMFLMAQFVLAQGVLTVTDVSQPTDVYSNDNDDGALVVRCNASIPLTFDSSMDKSAAPFNTVMEGSDSVYYINFPTGRRYRGRILSIFSPGYQTLNIPLNIEPKRVVTLIVEDPNSLVDAGCYKEHRNKGLNEIKNMNYPEARLQFETAAECSEVDTAENNANLALVDTLISLRNKAELFVRLKDYRKAAECYNHLLSFNSSDTYAEKQMVECQKQYSDDCMMAFQQAEHFFERHEYDKAKELYQRVVDDNCANMNQAFSKIIQISELSRKKSEHTRVVTYEYQKDVPIGISTGSYNQHKAGGFFSLSMNSKIFEMARKENKVGDVPEANLSFGWTIKIVNPLWIFFGPGLTGKMYYGDYKDDYVPNAKGKPVHISDKSKEVPVSEALNDWDGDDKKKLRLNAAVAISPVVGLCVKYSYFALRVSYQYRFVMKKELEKFMGTQRLAIGIGVAF